MNKTYQELCDELQQVRAERDEWQARVEKAERLASREGEGFRAMCEAFQRLEKIVGLDTGGGMGPAPALNAVEHIVKERDALAAHVELANTNVDAFRRVDGSPLYLASKIIKWSDQSPQTSLAKLIAEKQAEAFEIAERHAKCAQDAAMLRLNAADLRRQAGGDV